MRSALVVFEQIRAVVQVNTISGGSEVLFFLLSQCCMTPSASGTWVLPPLTASLTPLRGSLEELLLSWAGLDVTETRSLLGRGAAELTFSQGPEFGPCMGINLLQNFLAEAGQGGSPL
jgi:hypothetical protein